MERISLNYRRCSCWCCLNHQRYSCRQVFQGRRRRWWWWQWSIGIQWQRNQPTASAIYWHLVTAASTAWVLHGNGSQMTFADLCVPLYLSRFAGVNNIDVKNNWKWRRKCWLERSMVKESDDFDLKISKVTQWKQGHQKCNRLFVISFVIVEL